jgi:hypothetical protein
MGIHPKKVIVTGDSAGGNLSIAISLMAIERGYRVPDALVPLYPSASCSKEYFWPSLLSSLDDPLISLSLLVSVALFYGPEGEENQHLGSIHPYMSFKLFK